LNSNHPQDLAWGLENLALLFQLTGRLSEAEPACRQSLALRQKLANEKPGDQLMRLNLSLCYEKLASILRDAKRSKEEERAYRESVAIRTKLVADFPKSAECYNGLAWHLATCPLEYLRDTAKAVELASKAVALTPSVGNYWNTLGVARYRAGDW